MDTGCSDAIPRSLTKSCRRNAGAGLPLDHQSLPRR
jgi:hypothetical protein